MSDSSSTATLLGGRYRLRSEIARGGMATVHRGVDDVLEREVAIKVLHRHLTADPTFRDRFLREARAAAGLSHPNVVAVYDWGEDDGDAYLVLEYIDGPSLREVLRARGRLDPAEAAAVLAPAAAGIAAAHRRGLVHRDVKPENILVGADGVVKVTDFGLARAVAATTHTFGPDSIVGSPHYLAPEAARNEPLDARTDVYALGVVLFECVVGHPPFQAETPLATAMLHTEESVPQPSTFEDVPPAVDEVVAASTGRVPADRLVDAAAFERALRGSVTLGEVPSRPRPRTGDTIVIPPETTDTVVPEPATTRPPTARPATAPAPLPDDGDPSPPRERRRRWAKVAIALVLLAVLAGSGFLVWDRLLAPVTDIPDVVRLSPDAATDVLEEAGFRVERADGTVFHLEIPEGTVAEQSPTGEARAGTTVTLTLSAGPPDVLGGVPDVRNQTLEEAQATLADANLTATVVESYDEQVEQGRVIAVTPEPGTSIEQGSSVELTVSLGRQPIEVPAVVGMGLKDAEKAIEGAELEPVVTEEVYDDNNAAGIVIAQRPGAGEGRFRGETVELTVSKGPRPFDMPNVRGKQRDEAVAILEAAGLVVEVREQSGGPFFVPSGVVADQDPKPGEEVRRGDRVTIIVWK